jgi:hypothetical protein
LCRHIEFNAFAVTLGLIEEAVLDEESEELVRRVDEDRVMVDGFADTGEEVDSTEN